MSESLKKADKEMCRTLEPLELMYSDVCGPVGIPSIGNANYFVTPYDDASEIYLVQFVSTNDQTSFGLKEMIAELKFGAVKNGLVRRIRMNNGGELIDQESQSWCTERGISPPYFS